MPKKPRAKRGSPKNVLRLPDRDHSKASVLQSPGSIPRNVPMPSPSMTSLPGTAPSPDWPSVAPSFSDTAMNWRLGGLPRNHQPEAGGCAPTSLRSF
jgi:hypothetical protein